MKNVNWLKKGFLMVLLAAAIQILFCIPVMAGYVPKVPTGLRQTGYNIYSINISFSVDEDVLAKKFEYQYSTDQTRWSEIETMGKLGKGEIIYLNRGTSYYVRVRALYPDNSRSEWCDPVCMTTTPHNLSKRPSIVSKTYNSLTVRWGASMTATDYRVICEQNDYEIKRMMVKAPQTSVTITGLDPDAFYKVYVMPLRIVNDFEVPAYNSDYDGFYTLPKTITGFEQYHCKWSPSLYNLDWDTPRCNPDGYRVEYRDLRTKKKYYANVERQSEMNLNLSRNRFYQMRVCCYDYCERNKKNYSPWSGYIYVNDKDAPSLKKVRGGIKASWGRVYGAHYYTLYAKQSGEDSYHKVCSTKKNTVTVKKIGGVNLKKGNTYQFYVVASRKVGKKVYRSGKSIEKTIYY